MSFPAVCGASPCGNVVLCCIALPAGQLVQLQQLADHLLLATVADALDDAMVQVAVQHHHLHLLDGPAHGEGLLQDLRAVLVLFDHAADPLEVTIDVVEPLQHFLSNVVLHDNPSHCNPSPLGGGFAYRLAALGTDVNGRDRALWRKASLPAPAWASAASYGFSST